MKKLFVFAVLTTLCLPWLHSQNADQEICGYRHEVDRLLKKYPNFLIWQNAWYEKALAEMKDAGNAKRNITADTLYLEIPVVFHVLYNKSEENISDALLLNQLDELNAAFRKLNADTQRIRQIFKDLAADVKIQFVLANRDPGGNASSGITRTYTSRTTFAINAWGSYSTNMKYSANGGKDAWDPTAYMNVWICNMQYPGGFGIVYGFATPPTGAPNWDFGNVTKDSTDPESGVVLHYKIVGKNNPLAPANYTEGKTAVHEVGHYLGLRHIWGDGSSQTGCTVDDGIFDTPNARQSNSTCFGQNTCTDPANDKPDMTENYMDYALDGCAAMFTRQQAWIMRYVLNNFRSGLPARNIVYDTLPDSQPQPSSVEINVFPNPVSQGQSFSVSTGSVKGQIYRVSVTDLSGRIVIGRNVASGSTHSFDLSGVAGSFYIVTVRDSGGKILARRKLAVM